VWALITCLIHPPFIEVPVPSQRSCICVCQKVATLAQFLRFTVPRNYIAGKYVWKKQYLYILSKKVHDLKINSCDLDLCCLIFTWKL
jgi:hypothetical protein